MADAREMQFQQDIIDNLLASGWLLGKSEAYNRELAIYEEDVIAYVQDTQPEQWDKLAKHFPYGADTAF